jgi:hypothetical protein
MAFRTFDRKLYFALETTEGTFVTPNASSGYLETIDPSWTVTPRMFERNPTRLSVTPAPQVVAGTSKTAPAATVEFSFSVELTGSGTTATVPRWGDLLKACGMRQVESLNSTAVGNLNLGSSSVAPAVFYNNENFGFDSGTAYGPPVKGGRVVGDTFYDDGTLYYVLDGAPATWTAGDNAIGQRSDTNAVASSPSTGVGTAWVMDAHDALGGGNSSSVSFVVYLDNTNAALAAQGCRGTVDFVFAAGDRVMMNFTFMGTLKDYTETGTPLPIAEGRPLPPAFVNADMVIQDSSYGTTDAVAVSSPIFNSITISLGNDLVVRENPSVSSGYGQTYITGRTPTMTWNPDAVLSTEYDFWKRFLVGETTRCKLNVGTAAGNKFLFKVPALQFTGLADSSSDEVVVYDTTSTMTGGDYGSSIQQTTGIVATQTSSRLGTNNEFMFIHL